VAVCGQLNHLST